MRPVPLGPCLALIHEFEGRKGAFEPTRVLDPTGNWEIGWSHKLAGPDDPRWSWRIGAEEADTLAMQDLNETASGVCNELGDAVDRLSVNQYAAIIDFTYNEGIGRFAGATLCQCIKTGVLAQVPSELAKWVYGRVAGVETILPGLKRRRDAEIALWNT